MKPIPIFQIVSIDDTRVVIRHYNEKSDRFEKVCSAGSDDYQLLRDRLLIAPDGRIYYSDKGTLLMLGTKDDFVSMLSGKLLRLDVSLSRLPFKHLFVSRTHLGLWYDEADSYEERCDNVVAHVSGNHCWTYSLEERETMGDYGPEIYYELYRK